MGKLRSGRGEFAQNLTTISQGISGTYLTGNPVSGTLPLGDKALMATSPVLVESLLGLGLKKETLSPGKRHGSWSRVGTTGSMASEEAWAFSPRAMGSWEGSKVEVGTGQPSLLGPGLPMFIW